MQKDNQISKRGIVLSIISLVILYAFDRVSKSMALLKLKDHDPIAFFNDSFELFYLENRGAAWGILRDKIWLLVGVTGIVTCIIIAFYLRIPKGKRYMPLRISLVLIVSGALGNLVDRIKFNHVIDFLYVKAIDFPVFNIADCYVTIGAFIIIVVILFVYKESELSFWSFNSKSEE